MTSLQMGFIDQYLLNNNNNNNNNNKKAKRKKRVFGYANSQTHNIYKQWEIPITHMHAASTMHAWGANVDTHFRDTFFTSSIQSSPTALRAQFMYYIIFYSFKHGRNPCDIFEEIEEVWFGGYELIHFEPFA